VRDLAAGVGFSLLAIAGIVATMAVQQLPTQPDPNCQMAHQQVRVEMDFDFWQGAHQLSWRVVNVCDRWGPLPPPALPIPGP
jgi:methionine-rich copper-binding protein CopC